MTAEKDHISVCICTFKRPELLKRLLEALIDQETLDRFTYSVVVSDNDKLESGRRIVFDMSAACRLPITYCVEPIQNIARARNKALAHARGNFIAFIDDDEVPGKEWLCNLFKTCKAYSASGVLGPVKPYFEHEPPQWLMKGRFCERPCYPTGYRLNRGETRTGNVLFKREILRETEPAFRPEFGTGSEDVDFFSRMMKRGNVFVWCNEAAVHELVPPSRCSRTYFLKRALLRGSTFPKRSSERISGLLKSLIAVPVYTVILPVLAIFGQHLFMSYLIKLFDHASRILAFLGVKLVREREVKSVEEPEHLLPHSHLHPGKACRNK